MKERKEIKGIVTALKKDPEILAIILYGSSARGENTPVSDIDICVVLMPGVRSALDLSRKKLAFASHFSGHISIFQQLPIYIRQRVLKEGKVLFSKDTDALYEVAFAFIRELFHFEPIYKEYLEGVVSG